MSQTDETFASLTANIVSAYVTNNAVPQGHLPDLIMSTYAALAGILPGSATTEPTPSPAVSIKKSITPDFLICLEDGKKFKSLKRHLRTAFNMTPDQYRAKWRLPPDYPMVAPAYAEARSQLAKKNRLGQPLRRAVQARRALAG